MLHAVTHTDTTSTHTVTRISPLAGAGEVSFNWRRSMPLPEALTSGMGPRAKGLSIYLTGPGHTEDGKRWRERILAGSLQVMGM